MFSAVKSEKAAANSKVAVKIAHQGLTDLKCIATLRTMSIERKRIFEVPKNIDKN